MPTNSHSIDLEIDSNQWLSAADSVSLSPTGSFTVSAWLRYESFTGNPLMFSKHNSVNGQKSFYILHYSATGNWQIVTSVDGSAETSSDVVAWTPTLGTWYHFAAVFNAPNHTIEFYIDGSSLGAPLEATNTSIYDSATDFRISWTGAGNQFDGMVDEVGFWKRTFSAAEVANLYNRNNTYCDLISTDANLSAFWNLNNVLTDSSGNGNTLTNNNSAVFSTTVPFASHTCEVAAAAIANHFLLMGV